MSDPDFVQDLPPPPPPPRKTQPQSQLESDEAYARQLAEEYGDDSYTGFGARGQGNPPLPSRRRETGLKPNELHDKEHSFFDGCYLPLACAVSLLTLVL
jgi:hypothetical protein